MADSDDEHDRSRSRDKFRRERSDYGDKSRSRGGYREKRSWRDDDSGRRRSRDESERDRRRYSPSRGRDWSPPPKRMRREGWEGFRDFPPGMMPYGIRPPWMPHDMPPGPHVMSPGAGIPMEPPGSTPHGGLRRQAMLSFKQFLTQQDDSIDESEATAKYNEYKIDFKRTVIKEFFDEHKDEDWLISRYHPVPMKEREAANRINLQARVAAFLSLMESGKLSEVSLDHSNVDEITKTMDTAVIKMEGGSDHDLLALDQTFNDEGEGEGGAGEEGQGEKKEGTEDKLSFVISEPTEEQRQLAEQARDYGKQMQDDVKGEGEGAESREQEQEGALPEPEQPKKSHKKKLKDVYSYTEGDESEGSSSESEREDEGPDADEPPPPGLEPADVAPPGAEEEEEGAEPPPPGMEEPLTGEVAPSGGSSALPETGQTETAVPEQNGVETSGVGAAEAELPPPNPLHVTRSVYIRHIPPKISSDDIVEVCRTIPGYLRVAFADPSPDRGYERRGWVTYKHDTDIMDVSARLSTVTLKDVQLNCMVNRDLTRRVKQCPLGGVAWARRAIHSDLLLALKLISALDQKGELWEYASLVQPTTGESDGEEVEQPQSNPVLSIPDSILTEDEEPMATGSGAGGGAEEEEGVVSDPGTEITSNEDEKLKTLDRLIWYLRIVHSVDYYNTTIFPSEDNMPHRCGIITARGSKPQAITQDEVSEYVEVMGSKVKPLLETKKELTDDEMEKYSKKDPEAEVERFMEMNTQKLSDSKYLCPLSGKKFKGPEFVKKHIFNKHMDKVDACRQEAEFFNYYLRDQDRPMPVEPSVTSTPSLLQPTTPTSGVEEMPGAGASVGGTGRVWGQTPPMMFGGGFPPGFPPGMMGRGQFRLPRFRGGRRGRGRKVIQYHDLDAPEDMY